MVRRFLLAAMMGGLSLGSAVAQEPAAAGTTRCGGLLCDLYYSGKPAPAPGQPEVPDPTHLPCRDFLCAAFGGRTPDPVPPAVAEPAAATAPTPATKSAKHKAKPRRTVAAADATVGK